jgi:hypothetical protein
MIVVRSLAEAAVYARATGHTPYATTSPRPGVHVWRCWWRDERRELTFVEQRTAPPVLGEEAFAEVAHDLLAAAPPVATGFVRTEVRRVIEDLTLALYAFDQAAADPAHADPAARAEAQARRLVWTNALVSAPAPRPLDQLPLPAHGFAAPPDLARWIATAAPFPTRGLPQGWAVVDRAEDGRFLLGHDGSVYAWATRDADTITALAPLEAREALAVHVQMAGVLEEVQRARLRATLRPGVPLATALTRLLAPGESAAPTVVVSAPPASVRFFTLTLVDPSPRHAVLVVTTDAAGAVVGHRVIEGLDGWETRLGIEEAALALPGEDGSRPVLAAKAEADAHARQIAADVEPLLTALLDPTPALRDSLRPRPGDAARVFSPADAARVEPLYARLWDRDPPRVRAPGPRVTLRIAVATAGMLAADDTVAATFPARWRTIAGSLVPDRTWVAWAYVPEGGGRAEEVDGLVWLDDRWVWFPAPWRVLAMDRAG